MNGILYELINPSDTVTFIAPNFDAAFCAVLLVGRGSYTAAAIKRDGQRLDDEEAQKLHVPHFLFGGVSDWEKDNNVLIHDMMTKNMDEIVQTLQSFICCSVRERHLMDMALEAITDDDKRREFLDKWNDDSRTSMNDIVGGAKEWAHAIWRDGIEKFLTAKEEQDAQG